MGIVVNVRAPDLYVVIALKRQGGFCSFITPSTTKEGRTRLGFGTSRRAGGGVEMRTAVEMILILLHSHRAVCLSCVEPRAQQ